MHFKRPMLIGFVGFIISQFMLIIMPERSYVLLFISTVLDACSIALVNPQVDSMIVWSVDPAERARIMAILYMGMISLTSPFGWIAGELSQMNRALPFVLNVFLFIIGGGLVLLASRIYNKAALTGNSPA